MFISLLLDLVCSHQNSAYGALLTSVDIVYLHLTSLPQITGVLPQCRNTVLGNPSVSDIVWIERIQEQLLEAYQRSV